MQNSFFVAFLLEMFSSTSMPRWPLGQYEFLISREISLCPFFCLNHPPPSTHIHSFLSWISICCRYSQCSSQGEWDGQMPLRSLIYQNIFIPKRWQGKLHHPYICLGKRKQQNDGLWCQCLFQGNKKCVCGELEEIKNVCRYRWLLFGIHNWADSLAKFVSLAFENPSR